MKLKESIWKTEKPPIMKENFIFLKPGKLIDNDLELVLYSKDLADEKKEFVPGYVFNMKNSQTGEKMGQIKLRVGYNEKIKYGGHVGYGVNEKFRGHHYAARSLKLIFPLAKKHRLNPLYVTCDPENIPSRKTCERAGGTLEEIVNLPKYNDQYIAGKRNKCRYRFDL